MRNALLLAFAGVILPFAGPAPAQKPETPALEVVEKAPKALDSITAEDLQRHLKILSSDEYEGRLTGTRGQFKAAEYISKHFAACGLEPWGDAGEDGTRAWTQGYDVTLSGPSDASGLYDPKGQRVNRFGAWNEPRRRRSDPAENGASAGESSDAGNSANGTEPARRRGGREPLKIQAPLRWLGRVVKGDLEGQDLSKVIPVVRFEMDASRDDRVTVMTAMTTGMQRELGKVRVAAAELSRAGAPAAVIITEKFNLPFIVAANMLTAYPGKPQVDLGKSANAGGMMGAVAPRPQIPVLILDGADALAVAQAFGWGAEDAFGLSGKAAAGAETPESWQLVLESEVKPIKAVNVVGVLKGRDPELAAEAIVYSAHMDHVGMGPDGRPFNGADDDGSGTVSLLELAEAYGKLPPGERPARSVIFLSVSGEELGLWGSAHYAKEPTWPLDKIIADINIDMIGRSTKAVPEDVVAVTPTYKHRAYSTIAREAAYLAEAYGMRLGDGDRFYERSDHYNFAEKGVPVVFFTDDEHDDYHMPSDDWDKIEYDKMQKIVRLAFLLGWRTADRAEAPSTIGAHTDWFGTPKRKRSEGRGR